MFSGVGDGLRMAPNPALRKAPVGPGCYPIRMNDHPAVSRREVLHRGALLAAALALPPALRWTDPDRERLQAWTGQLRTGRLAGSEAIGKSVVRVGELAAGTPYEPGTLEAYLKAGGSPLAEPLIVSLTHFDCVTLVEGCLAVSRTAAASGPPTWEQFCNEMERMRYRSGKRNGYSSRLHYFSEWISDGASRRLVRDMGQLLGGVNDERPLRFMTEHRGSYPALVNDDVFTEIGAMERRLDGAPRWVVSPAQLPKVTDQIQSGDLLAFATSIAGLDVTHSAMAYRDHEGTLRVLHAPLSGGVVEVTRSTLIEYVAAIKRCTGVMVARPLGG
jgi:hypothetical protein